MWRSSILALTLAVSTLPAHADWAGPWGEKPFWERSEPRNSYGNTARRNPNAGRYVAKAPYGYYEDEEDYRPARKAKPKAAAKPKLEPKAEPVELVQGGARPNIVPQEPETVAFDSSYPVGSIVIDTAGRKLYYVKSGGMAFRYPIAVGKVGFTWTGSEQIARKQAWPDWIPPAEMRERKPELPERMTGGVNNPLGAMALYLGNSLYRIHGTSDAKSIGTASSSGCFRMHNAHVVHLASLADVGTKVTVLKSLPSRVASAR